MCYTQVLANARPHQAFQDVQVSIITKLNSNCVEILGLYALSVPDLFQYGLKRGGVLNCQIHEFVWLTRTQAPTFFNAYEKIGKACSIM